MELGPVTWSIWAVGFATWAVWTYFSVRELVALLRAHRDEVSSRATPPEAEREESA